MYVFLVFFFVRSLVINVLTKILLDQTTVTNVLRHFNSQRYTSTSLWYLDITVFRNLKTEGWEWKNIIINFIKIETLAQVFPYYYYVFFCKIYKNISWQTVSAIPILSSLGQFHESKFCLSPRGDFRSDQRLLTAHFFQIFKSLVKHSKKCIPDK